MPVSSPRTILERAASVANLAMLRAQFEPSHTQIEVIKDLTSLSESELACLSPTDTSETGDRILAQLAIHRSILAPIRRVPVELLSEIFSRVVHASPLRTLPVATTLSHICSAWRNIARAHAALWTKLVVKTLRDFDDYHELFLPLTKQMPLELQCDDREILKDLWDRIAPYASRWRRIELEGRLSMLPDLQVLYMENLERLVVDVYDAPISRDLSALDFVVAPRLRHIALTLDVLRSERQLHVPATRSLTSLEITSVSPFPVTLTLPLLQACADTLQALTIEIRQASDGADGSYSTGSSDPFLMKALTYLSLVDSSCALLSLITAPLTEELVFSAVPSYCARSLLGLLDRGEPTHLHTLEVYDAEEREPSAWIPCLQLMGNLRRLHFDDLLANNAFLEKLIRRPDRPLFLPALEGVDMWRRPEGVDMWQTFRNYISLLGSEETNADQVDK
ncbi:hypothetical protein K525DRAFT_187991 [Schizophyllum commune Loenen D]|nr:hypothetical protein K525DRAFT_187991 [Schizophyllum commune Loenen D]